MNLTQRHNILFISSYHSLHFLAQVWNPGYSCVVLHPDAMSSPQAAHVSEQPDQLQSEPVQKFCLSNCVQIIGFLCIVSAVSKTPKVITFFMDDPKWNMTWQWSKPLSSAAVEDKVECGVGNKEEVVEVTQAKPAARQAQPSQPGNQSWGHEIQWAG